MKTKLLKYNELIEKTIFNYDIKKPSCVYYFNNDDLQMYLLQEDDTYIEMINGIIPQNSKYNIINTYSELKEIVNESNRKIVFIYNNGSIKNNL